MTTSTTINGGVRQWKGYSAYKETGIEWFRHVPTRWQVMAVKFALNMPITDGPHETPEFIDDGIPFLSAESVKDDRLDFSRKRGFISQADHARYSKKYLPRRGDIFMVKSGATTGNVARVQTDEEFNIWSPLAVLRPNPVRATTDFVFYFMKSRGFLTSVELAWSYGTQQNIGMGVVSNLRIALPPLDDQHRIVAFLDRETAKIDALIAKKERLIELLQEKRTALISHAVTKGLDPSVPMTDSGVEWLGKVPAHWTPKKLKYLFRFAKRLNHPDLTVLSVYRDYGVIEKTTRDDNHNKTPEDLTTYQLVNVGDLVINKMKAWQGSLGISSLHGITSPDYVVYRSTNNEHLPYLHHRLRIPGMASTYHCISNGIRPDQWRLEPDKFEQLWLHLPPMEEQQEICEHIDKQITAIDSLRARIQDGIDKLREYRTTLISAAVTGKIDVREEVA